MILIGSLMPATSVSDIGLYDKEVHFILYAIFSYLLYLFALSRESTVDSISKRWIYVLLVGSLAGIAVELIQHYFITDRFGDLMDVFANTLGILVALFFSELLKVNGAL